MMVTILVAVTFFLSQMSKDLKSANSHRDGARPNHNPRVSIFDVADLESANAHKHGGLS